MFFNYVSIITSCTFFVLIMYFRRLLYLMQVVVDNSISGSFNLVCQLLPYYCKKVSISLLELPLFKLMVRNFVSRFVIFMLKITKTFTKHKNNPSNLKTQRSIFSVNLKIPMSVRAELTGTI